MISPSQRNRKPYALPLCCTPYHSLTEEQARAHINSVITAMKKKNMKVAGLLLFIYLFIIICKFILGFVSNGEYNVFKTKGYTRPLSVL